MEELIHILPHALRMIGYEESACERVLQVAWARLVGDAIAARTFPMQLREGRLIVLTADRTWKAQLEKLSPDILARINRLLGADLVQAIEYRVKREVFSPRPKEQASSASPQTALDERLLRELTPLAESIADPDLREAFLRAASRCLARREGT
ncbi:MAG: DUF721 domain-containing protein [Blastocatellia bacterium]|nr:DUF721 domain-containing protein [Blastocatellia bacterium]MCS7157556.1 DUF721 domain-containing protein [Blastocatellia bacterium]MCX7753508.1 DUF721 domain-containing protein [Blastocatellia bacterium]MDW8166924.1 DUF721 domain-containing protein [Acidobacteriota bacterium]MDW8257501.1 DUF721 domain-containing protein [Acidobacteriota bacterium]